MNILIGIPSPEWISPCFAFDNLPALIAYTKANLKGLDNLYIRYQQGVRTDKNRNVILKSALDKGDVDYILWLDADMMFPPDMVCKYLENPRDVVGCLYFKRSSPFSPVGYYKGNNPLKPYKAIDPLSVPNNSLIEVDGLGFGGMMVKTSVYEAMGDDKWMVYGKNFHLPFDTEDGLTHDLEFCKRAQEHGFKIHLHTGVKPGHLSERVTTQADYETNLPKKETITVIIPTIHPEKAKVAADYLKYRAGVDCKVVVIEDIDKSGWVATTNMAVRNNPSDYYVYAADDVWPGKDWLKIGLETLKEKGGGVLAFNDGKWFGKMASFGLVSHDFMIQNYQGNIFFPGYHSQYADPELSILALQQNKLHYNPNAVLMEIHDKRNYSNSHEDRDLFAARKKGGFDGKVTDSKLLNAFS